MDTDRLAASLAEKVDPQRIMQLTLDMVRIPSPPGQERAVSEFYADELRGAGLNVELDSEFPDSPSVVSWLRGRRGGPTLQLDGHTDTVDLPGPEPRFEGGYHPRTRVRGHEGVSGGDGGGCSRPMRIGH